MTVAAGLRVQAQTLRREADKLDAAANRLDPAGVLQRQDGRSGQKPRAEGDAFTQMKAWFCFSWKQHHDGAHYVEAPGDNRALGRVLSKIPAGELGRFRQAVLLYLACRETFIVRQGHSMTYLASNFPRWWAEAGGDKEMRF